MKFQRQSLVLVVPFIILIIWLTSAADTDRPCLRKYLDNGSADTLVCVCTSDYCDSVTRAVPSSGEYVLYMSSEAGSRFEKSFGKLQSLTKDGIYNINLDLDPGKTYQTIEGFGGAVSDAAAITWDSLKNPVLKNHLIQSYCGETGIQYNMLRVPIGGSDFSTRAYAYNELPENDAALTNFTLAYEDYQYKIPMIRACMQAAGAPVHVLGATWSPPIWMKTNNDYYGYSLLKKEYLQTYADYHYKFLEHYAQAGVPVWGVSIVNEPLHGSVNYLPLSFNNLGWTLDFMNEYIVKHLGPTLRNEASKFKHVKIISGDDLRFTITLYWNMLVLLFPGALEYLDGVAVHYYMNKYVPATILSQAMEGYPGKFVIATEICAGGVPDDALLTPWGKAELYVNDIIENLSNNVIGYTDWNMCLNMEGGPNWRGGRVDAPIKINAEAGEFYKQPMFYAIGHFSKFIPRGSRRIRATVQAETAVQNLAFLTPDNTIVVVLFNKGPAEKVRIILGKKEAVLSIEAKSIATIEMLNE
ncbi:glucosylceramidase-like [Trichoplusia ni]|uniref:Glucosylceramidase n=1 Tax=Trichoplusia ni TaxID=7111 RepID=A0A7E5WKE6_TRINI|nr:glucosylceramidase-like [Trichoplusia ni]